MPHHGSCTECLGKPSVAQAPLAKRSGRTTRKAGSSVLPPALGQPGKRRGRALGPASCVCSRLAVASQIYLRTARPNCWACSGLRLIGLSPGTSVHGPFTVGALCRVPSNVTVTVPSALREILIAGASSLSAPVLPNSKWLATCSALRTRLYCATSSIVPLKKYESVNSVPVCNFVVEYELPALMPPIPASFPCE